MMTNRRNILKGMTLGAGSVLLSPILQKLEAHASGQETASAKRFVFIVEGNGITPEQIQPKSLPRRKEQDRTTFLSESLLDQELPFALAPLNDYKARLSIIQGLSGRICGGGHSNNFGALGVYSSKAGAFDETVDAALAKALPSLFNHVALGITDRPEHAVVYNISAWGPGKKLPMQCKPDLAYSTLFGSVAEGSAKQAFEARKNLLDFLSADVKKVEARLGGEEREKFQAYVQSYESMKDRQSKLNEIAHTLRKAAPVVSDKYTSLVETDRLDAHFDIGAAALIGGLTNVLVIGSGNGDPYFSIRFKGLGIDLDK
ncbi:MAG: DUF1552 domain-containing protein, partial [Planctomycetes bacterium]|nr:DUF1552 domain-containing protein [Planctomycetota bacterium]